MGEVYSTVTVSEYSTLLQFQCLLLFQSATDMMREEVQLMKAKKNPIRETLFASLEVSTAPGELGTGTTYGAG